MVRSHLKCKVRVVLLPYDIWWFEYFEIRCNEWGELIASYK